MRRFRPEDGSMLIEVLVSALLVAIMAAAFFGALSGSSRVSGTSKARAIAAGLAQNDQERLRSMPVAALSTLSENNTKNVAGVDYTVTSTAEWVADATQTNTDCTANGATADYLRITSTVAPTNLAATSLTPVKVTSTVTPAPGTFNNLGALLVSVVDRNGVGLASRTVNISGPVTDGALTNAQGCAFFGYEPVGDYTVTTSAVGYVDAAGNSTATTTASVGNETTATAQLQYDLAGAASLTFDTVPRNAAGVLATSPQSAPSWVVTVSHGGNVRTFGPSYPTASPYTSPVAATPVAATKLFPWTDPYGIYAGDCNYNDPGTLTPPPPGASLTVLPGKLDHTLATPVRVPAVNVLTKLNGVPTSLAVRFTNATAGCGVFVVQRTTQGAAAGAGVGLLQDPGLPYGQYYICVDNGLGGSSGRKLTTGMPLVGATPLTTSSVPLANTAADGTPVVVFDVKNTSPTGSC
jgi:Tfp pilus assembly protein PilV